MPFDGYRHTLGISGGLSYAGLPRARKGELARDTSWQGTACSIRFLAFKKSNGGKADESER
jgi:hypothetical protein